MAAPREPIRSTRERQDLGSIEAIKYNDPAGSGKMIIIEPVVKRPTILNEIVGPGSYVKVTGTSYTLDLLGRAYDVSKTYLKGDIVSSGADIYMALEDKITGAFDVTKWRRVAPKQIGPVTIVAGAVVCTGRWHNSVTGAGFLVDDNSEIRHISTRD